MQRPRNRQGGEQQSRGRGGRGRGSRGGRGGPLTSYPTNVPRSSQVVPGAHVSIVLKADQGTGREVQGTVADVLTSGDHPRGMKVRLQDGRVGRVQLIVTEEEARAGSEGLSGLGRNGEVGSGGEGRDGSRGTVWPGQGTGDAPPVGYNLSDFLPPGHPLLQAEAEATDPSMCEVGLEDVAGLQQESGVTTAGNDTVVVKCPVCNEFEGDEAAVAHHVNSHFD